MLRITSIMIVIIGALAGSAAHADCTFSTGPCSTDSYGNTYRTERNFGSGYTTHRNGTPFSTTDQTLGGTYREHYIGGGSRSYNYDPYDSLGKSESGYRQ